MSYATSNTNASFAAACNEVFAEMDRQDLIAFYETTQEVAAEQAEDQGLQLCTACNEYSPTSNYYGKQKRCKPCYIAVVKAQQYKDAIPTVYGIVVDQRICYVGSTQMSLTTRLQAHVSAANQDKESRIAQYLRIALEAGHTPTMVALQELPGATKKNLLRRERVWVRRMGKVTTLHQVQYVKSNKV